jgi:8-oxo-dGTP diphosphatase
MKKIEVVAAIIYYGDEILCVQRPENKYSYISKKFEFPGGKIEDGETKQEALKREILEELGINLSVCDFFLTVIHSYPDFELTMHSFICKVFSKNVRLSEHISLKWLTVEKLNQLNWAAADIPIVNKLVNNENVTN